jgi:Phytanoyl-CoA dioxygenase (PhyH)
MTTTFTLSPAQLQSFQQDGYFKIEAFIPEFLLTRLRALFNELIGTDNDEDKVVLETDNKKYVTNLEYVCRKGNLSAFQILGYPPLLQIAETICGEDFFMIQEFAVIKNAGDKLPVLWHQDMLHERKGKCFTIGFYLDDAEIGEGALSVIPGSHSDERDICELSKGVAVAVPAKAGDVIIHDMMLAHSSGLLNKNKIRRVLYFEFLSARHVEEEKIYTKELVERRTRLIFAAVRFYKQLHPGENSFIYKHKNSFPNDDTKEIENILTEVYSKKIHARPSAYCFEIK